LIDLTAKQNHKLIIHQADSKPDFQKKIMNDKRRSDIEVINPTTIDKPQVPSPIRAIAIFYKNSFFGRYTIRIFFNKPNLAQFL
jgi:hypothetical protein